MTNKNTLARILEERVIGIVRLDETAGFVRIAQAFLKGGLCCLEITMTTPGVLDGIEAIANEVPEVVIGAGTVLDLAMARQAVRAGARFLVTPTATLDVLAFAAQEDVVSIPGAMTPSEIHQMWKAGADLVKVFPASLGGPSYFRSIKGPFPNIRLAATGGVSLENAAEFIQAGSSIVCVGGWLVPKDAVRNEEYSILTKRAEQLLEAIRAAI